MSCHGVDEEVMKEVVARVGLLEAIEAEPRTLRELEEVLQMSRSTIHRTTTSLIERGVLEKRGEAFALSGVGGVVVESIDELQDTVTGARHLEPFLNTVGLMDVDVPIHHFRDAAVITPFPHQAHVGVNRIIELIERSDSLSMFSSIISPLYVNAAHREILEGMEITVVFDERTVETIASAHYEKALEAFETGRFDVYVTGDVPFELFLFDDRMGMAAHDENAHAQALVETTSTDAIDWATELYERFESKAVQPDLW